MAASQKGSSGTEGWLALAAGDEKPRQSMEIETRKGYTHDANIKAKGPLARISSSD